MSRSDSPASRIQPRIDLARRIGVGLTYYGGRLSRRDRHLWVFGNARGFGDNPRYLAEHVLHDHPDLLPCWVARTPEELAAARQSGLNVVLRGTSAAARVQRRAGAAFLTNGFQDLDAHHLGGAFVVDLGHGKGLKRILLDMPAAGAGERRRWVADRLRRRLARHRLSQVSMVVAQGEWAAQRYASAYGLPPSRIRVLGTPRFDVLLRGPAFERLGAGDLRQRIGAGVDDHLVLWLPTWRDTGDASWLPTLDPTLLDALAETRVRLVVKAHPFSEPWVYRDRLPEHPRLRILEDGNLDVNCLLTQADALITDYSSAAFDYALLDRPIHFLVPDAEHYRGGAGLYEPLERISAGRHHLAWDSLLPEIREASLGRDAGPRAAAARIRELSRNRDEPGSSERIVEAVKTALRLPAGGPEPRSDGWRPRTDVDALEASDRRQ